MSRMIRCECGYVARHETDDEVVDDIQSHIGQDHPDLLEKVSRDDIQSWVQIES